MQTTPQDAQKTQKNICKNMCIISLAIFILLLSSFSVNAAANASTAQGSAIAEQGVDKQYTATSAGSDISEGGNVTELNISSIQSTKKWQGYHGLVNGTVMLGDGSNALFNFGSVIVNLIFATLDNNFNFASITNDTGGLVNGASNAGTQNNTLASQLDLAFFNSTGDDPRTHRDSANRTFTSRNAVGGIDGVLYVDLLPAGSFRSFIVQNGSLNQSHPAQAAATRSSFAFIANITEGGVADFNGGANSEYEIIVPTRTTGSAAGFSTYYFFLDVD